MYITLDHLHAVGKVQIGKMFPVSQRVAGGHEYIAGKLPQLLPVQVLILEHFHVIGFVEGLTPYDPQVKAFGGHAAYGIPGIGLFVAKAHGGE